MGLASGAGLAKLRELVVAQGGRGEVVESPSSLIGEAERIPVEVRQDGYVAGIDARRIGLVVRSLKASAGEEKRACGVLLHKKTGDAVAGAPLAEVLVARGKRGSVTQAVSEVRAAFDIADVAPRRPSLLAAVVQS
jgi:pyrimidine-nucleoside phosphorylase